MIVDRNKLQSQSGIAIFFQMQGSFKQVLAYTSKYNIQICIICFIVYCLTVSTDNPKLAKTRTNGI